MTIASSRPESSFWAIATSTAELTYCPNLEGWTGDAGHTDGRFGLNGSYLAVRQIEQKVKAFENYQEPKHGEGMCEKLMGRRKTGLPLSWKGDPKASMSDSKADAFRFRVDDTNGFGCPKGAHIRRVNPRDSLGVDVKASIKSTKLHRLLRRGRPYLEKRPRAKTPRKGIFFIACNADLERQFEFIHQRWVRNPNFACLHDQDDPVVGSSSKFSIPGLASGEEMSLARLYGNTGRRLLLPSGDQSAQIHRGPRPVSASSRGIGPRLGERTLAHSEIDAIRALLGSKPRPVGWAERRQRLDEVGSTWPVADDVKMRGGRLRRRAGRMVARARQRRVARAAVLSTAAAIAPARSSATAAW